MSISLLALVFEVLLFVPTISALCAPCSSYASALTSCSSGSNNVSIFGSHIDTAGIHCMCNGKTSYAQMNSCSGCEVSSYEPDQPNIELLLAWENTCKADNKFGDQQAVSCWEGQPGDITACVLKNGGGGSGSGGSGGFPVSSAASR